MFLYGQSTSQLIGGIILCPARYNCIAESLIARLTDFAHFIENTMSLSESDVGIDSD